jgi:DNA-directed RNA polymerase subunit RPC12/RpoP
MSERRVVPWSEASEAYDAGQVVSWDDAAGGWVVEDSRAARPEPVAERAGTCARCGGRVVRALEVDGTPDDHCLACGHRVAALAPEAAERLRQEIEAREVGEGGRRVTRRRVQGVAL